MIKNVWQSRMAFTSLLLFICSIYTIFNASWPEIYFFDTNFQQNRIERLFKSPIHLSDDVMISLRSGYIFNETGIPAFNRTDLAQPSTSYVAPYLFAVLAKIFPQNISVAIYAMLGFIAVLLTFTLILGTARSKFIGAILVCALNLTVTNTHFALMGWDHLFQALFLTLGVIAALRREQNWFILILTSISLGVGCLFRPDGIFIAISAMFSIYFIKRDIGRFLIFSVAPFCVISGGALLLNIMQFGHITPTTARLKIGAAPSMNYIVGYLLKSGLFSFSAITLSVMLVIFILIYRKTMQINVIWWPIVIGCFLTIASAAFNSDIFKGGRMFWSSACALSAIVALRAPSLFKINWDCLKNAFQLSKEYNIGSAFLPKSFFKRSLLLSLLLMIILATFSAALRNKLSVNIVRDKGIKNSACAQQYKIAKWIENNLTPNDGAIGLYFLGISFHLPSFEIADFLGKADEIIATTEVKWGPPGHNKWDTLKTLNKWNPQAIIPARNSDRTIDNKVENAQKAIAQKQHFGFSSDLLLNEVVRKRFDYCYLLSKEPKKQPDTWGFFLRKDIAKKHKSCLHCITEEKF